MYKVLNSYLNLDISSLLNIYLLEGHYTLRRFDGLKLKNTMSGLLVWNSLPKVVQSSCNLSSLK